MQAKISSFFKRSTPDDAEAPTVSDDVIVPELSSKQEIVVTYARRAPKSCPTRDDDNGGELHSGQDEQPVSVDSKLNDPKVCLADYSSVVTSSVGRDLSRKRNYAQYHLELGQSDFLLHTCSICGLKFARGDEDDEKVHKAFHLNFCHGIPFKGWRNERVISGITSNADRIVLVLDGDPSAHRHKVAEVVKIVESELGLSDGWLLHSSCKVYLLISKQRVAGCLVAEPIRNAHRVISSSVPQKILDAKRNKIKSSTTTLQFGSVIFQREVIIKHPSIETQTIDKEDRGAVLCGEEVLPASCGIRGIWVSQSNRRKGFAKQLLDALRKSFCEDRILETLECAFSQPTSSGKALASSFSGTTSFLVYFDKCAVSSGTSSSFCRSRKN